LLAGSNLILKGALDEYGEGNPINFASWMQYATIPMLINLVICWLWLQLWYLGLPDIPQVLRRKKICCQKKGLPSQQGHANDPSQESIKKNQESTREDQVRKIIYHQYQSLGPINFHQVAVFILFAILIFLWFFREPQFMPGWGDFFHTRYYIKYNLSLQPGNA
jgi:sodium-dependent dicarboxylate transporter 2/3/5